MRADIEIYTQPYDDELSRDDIEFLRACKVDLDRPRWRDAILRESAHAGAQISTGPARSVR